MIRTRGTFTWIAAVLLSYGEYLAFNLRVWGLLQRYGRERQLRLMIQILPFSNSLLIMGSASFYRRGVRYPLIILGLEFYSLIPLNQTPLNLIQSELFQYVVMLVYYTINTRGQLTTLAHQPYYCRSGNGNAGSR